MFKKKLKTEISRLRSENDKLNSENTALKKYIDEKAIEEKAEIERMKKMADFWGYNGTSQIGL